MLHNFPKHLQHFVKPDGSVHDLAAIDILRSRERGVPRYNEFRRKFHLAPATTFEDFSDDPAVVSDLRRIYGDPEAVDTTSASTPRSRRRASRSATPRSGCSS